MMRVYVLPARKQFEDDGEQEHIYNRPNKKKISPCSWQYGF